jgi:hypothetical protein
MTRHSRVLALLLALTPMARAEAAGPIACNLGVFNRAERARHLELIAVLKEKVTEVRELPDGYAFRYDPDLLRPLAEWATPETKCCPFIDFQLELEPQPGGVAWLWLRGESEVKELIRTDFEPLIALAGAKAGAR